MRLAFPVKTFIFASGRSSALHKLRQQRLASCLGIRVNQEPFALPVRVILVNVLAAHQTFRAVNDLHAQPGNTIRSLTCSTTSPRDTRSQRNIGLYLQLIDFQQQIHAVVA